MQQFVHFWDRLGFLKTFKTVIQDKRSLTNIVNIANVYISRGYWPSYFKTSSSIIISKPNKMAYDFLKIYQPIVLLNTL